MPARTWLTGKIAGVPAGAAEGALGRGLGLSAARCVAAPGAAVATPAERTASNVKTTRPNIIGTDLSCSSLRTIQAESQQRAERTGEGREPENPQHSQGVRDPALLSNQYRQKAPA